MRKNMPGRIFKKISDLSVSKKIEYFLWVLLLGLLGIMVFSAPLFVIVFMSILACTLILALGIIYLCISHDNDRWIPIPELKNFLKDFFNHNI